MSEDIAYLVFDVETTGLPKDWNAPVSKLDNWPRMVQLGWLTFNDQQEQLEAVAHIIKPDDYTIPASSVSIHGISTETAREEGSDLGFVLTEFSDRVERTDTLVAHNLNFDEKVVGAELLRQEMQDLFSGKNKVCTKISGTDVCKIPGKYGYKWPRLGELFEHLFEGTFDETHDALKDAAATARCFFELKKRNVV